MMFSRMCVLLAGFLTGCSGAEPPLTKMTQKPVPSSAVPVPSQTPSSQSSAQAEVPPKQLAVEPKEVPAEAENCAFKVPQVNADFLPITLRYEKNPKGELEVAAEVWQLFPALSKDGRTVAIIDSRSNIDVGDRLYFVTIDIQTNKQSVLTLWSSEKHKSQQKEAQKVLDKTSWQTMVPGETVGEACRAKEPEVEKYTVRFAAADFFYVGEGIEWVLQRRSRTEKGRESRLEFKIRGLPGLMGQSAVPTNDYGGSCGGWALLDEGWVSQDGKVYLFKFGAFLGGRCDQWPAPVEYQTWISR